MNESARLIRLASISVDEWVKRVDGAARSHGVYPWKNTRIGEALLALEREAKAQPAPTPIPAPAPNALGRSWIFMAEDPDKAVGYPDFYGIAFTADSAYAKPSAATLKTLRDRGQRVRSWCDSHSTFPETAKQMANALGLDGWIGEGESAGACQVAFEAGAEIVIGNLSALTVAQKEWIRQGKTQWINELYLNQDPGRAGREDWMNLPVAGRCIAAYDASGENPGVGRRFPVSEYLRLGKFVPHFDSFYDPGATDDDRKALGWRA